MQASWKNTAKQTPPPVAQRVRPLQQRAPSSFQGVAKHHPRVTGVVTTVEDHTHISATH